MELLIYAVLSGVLLTATLSVLLSTNRSNSEMLRGMRLQDRWSRLSQLLDLEVAEGREIFYDNDRGELPTACGATAGTSSRVTIEIPYLAAAAGPISTTTIDYYLRGTDLWRCGPPFRADGRLDPTAPLVSSQLSNRMGFRLARSTSTPSNPDESRVLRYTIEFLTPEGRVLFSRSGAARTRVSRFE
ncbi:MAG: hypothetical protein VKJ44_09025 [Synechococcus sp.]|nr:hypothetical protein [Synechococcus sp.]